jgi:hypothetical protein
LINILKKASSKRKIFFFSFFSKLFFKLINKLFK